MSYRPSRCRLPRLEDFLDDIKERRLMQRRVSANYDFDMSRVKYVTKCTKVKKHCNGIMYYMQRDCRVFDNWALIFAQFLALRHNTCVYIVFPTKQDTMFPTRRQFDFLIQGLREVAAEAKRFGMKFYIVEDHPIKLTSLINENNIGALVTDFSPLREFRYCKEILDAQFPDDVPLIQVDTHNVVPVWMASDQEESSAKTFRPKVTKLLYRYINNFPKPAKFADVPNLTDGGNPMSDGIDDNLEQRFQPKVETVEPMPAITWAKPGPTGGFEILHDFIKNALPDYLENYNNPSTDSVSRLSPWLHFGFISAQRICLVLHDYKPRYQESIEKYLDHLIVRKELADNYCYYNENYDNLFGVRSWATETYNAHRSDVRRITYKQEELEQADTHDPLWNAAQRQLVREGRIHNYMRMYWGKKILEWTDCVVVAHTMSLNLNNTFSLDGNDPLAYTGILYCVGGLHDTGYGERAVFGKIRYMVSSSLIHRYKMDEYLRRYGCWKDDMVPGGVQIADFESLPPVVRKKVKPTNLRRKRRRLSKLN